MRNLTKKGFFISSKIGKAIADYNLIEHKDRILIAVSGGKDSLTLLKMLVERQKWAPVSYELLAAHVITDYRCSGCIHKKTLETLFTKWQCRFRFLEVKLRHSNKKEISCFWCAWNRRKALFSLAIKLGYNKLALAHHKDDIIETFLMNLFYNGEISSINAKQPLFGGRLTIIRPLVYVEEKIIQSFAKESGFPTQICKCPNSILSSRAFVKNIIKEVYRKCPHVKSNIFRAPQRIRYNYLCGSIWQHSIFKPRSVK